MIKTLVEDIAKSIVDRPEEVFVTEFGGDNVHIIELKVAREDTGKVIGRQGRTAGAIRTILSAASAKIKKRAILEILD